MPNEERIRSATCRVDFDGYQLGSAFWIADDLLVTAAHLVDQIQEDRVNLLSTNGEVFDARVDSANPNSDDDPGSDLATLEALEVPNEHASLPVVGDIPSIGTRVVWSGYARLIGESEKIDRQRCGWGRIASKQYGGDQGSFFEVDGLFNPGHSGGPVVDLRTGEVIGVVSASAGGFQEFEDELGRRSAVLQGLFNVSEGMSSVVHQNYRFDDPEEAMMQKRIFEALGLNVKTKEWGDGGMEIKLNSEQIPIRSGQILAEMSQILLDAAQGTFQMGVGIASGGDFLSGLVP